ncbi:MAG: metallophosphoesterase [Bdellovibrionaceae bacterium]|nr:metallophosphoesterase [Pseudobdellovibrionaceae bacterium]
MNMTSGDLQGSSSTEGQSSRRKHIKLVLSDLHLGKGLKLPDGGTNFLEEFYYGEKLVEFIHYYSSGIYRDYDIEIILNGDILNFLQVDYRGHFLSVITEPVALEILKSIVEGHKKVFAALREFCLRPGNSITYVIGNHDQAMMWPACRNYLNTVLGKPVRYKNIVYFFSGVHIEHGHMHEAANRIDPKKFFLRKDLPEPILNLPFGSHFFVDVVLKIKNVYPHVDKIRPFSKMVRWAVFNQPWVMLKAFASLAVYIVKSVFVKDPRRNWSLRSIAKIIWEGAIFPDLEGAARKILNDDRVHTVIFGHSHVYQYRQWGSDKEYFNTGTWTEVTSLDMNSLGRITKLTYVILEFPEDGGRPRGRLKEWHGYHRIEEDVAVS